MEMFLCLDSVIGLCDTVCLWYFRMYKIRVINFGLAERIRSEGFWIQSYIETYFVVFSNYYQYGI